MPGKAEKPEDPAAIFQDLRGCIDRRHRLYPVKFPKTHEMIIMTMGPDHCIDMRGSMGKQLLPEIR
jgi:hypothetical protein